ncbi:hypothetical protein LEP1GSC192_3599 [Leptospira sp. B5-022]|nr:hypothetical protein LEP1GSC192_3599 [Leptospira sp. B5-022]
MIFFKTFFTIENGTPLYEWNAKLRIKYGKNLARDLHSSFRFVR